MGGATDLLGGLGSLWGSTVGEFATMRERNKQRELIGQATDNIKKLDPHMAAQEAELERQGPSGFNQIGGQQTRADQLAALDHLKGIYQAGGLDPQARAEIAQQQANANQNAQALNAHIDDSMAQRGMASSGSNFAAQRANAQNAANNSNQAGMNALAMGQMRAQGALQAGAGLAGAIRGQDYGQAADTAHAGDAISRFNAANANSNNRFNAGQRAHAQQASFNNTISQADALNGQSAQYGAIADRTKQFLTGFGKGTGSAVGGAVDAYTGNPGGMSGGGGGGGMDEVKPPTDMSM